MIEISDVSTIQKLGFRVHELGEMNWMLINYRRKILFQIWWFFKDSTLKKIICEP